VVRSGQGRGATAGGDFLGVQLSGPALVAGDVRDRGDGNYEAVYTADDPGEYTLEVGGRKGERERKREREREREGGRGRERERAREGESVYVCV
jgi:hypothetical protein